MASTTCSVMSPRTISMPPAIAPVSIDFADAPAPILPRRSRLEPQDARQGGGAPGRHGLPRPRGRGRAAREERRHAPERRRRAHGPRVDGADARRARQRRSTRPGASATSSTSSRAPGRARLHHAAEGPGARPRGLRAPPADAARGRARHAHAHRARDPDRERARRREPARDRRRLRPHRDDHLRARRLRRRPRHPAAQRRAASTRSTRATSGTTSSRASSSRRGRAACRRSTAPTRRSATSTASARRRALRAARLRRQVGAAPDQIEILNEVYRPSQAQYDRAEALLEGLPPGDRGRPPRRGHVGGRDDRRGLAQDGRAGRRARPCGRHGGG